MREWCASFNFHPVGQGLFTSGMVRLLDHEPVWWVFDCGTFLRKHYVDLSREINELSDIVKDSRKDGSSRLDVVFISHFDRDHVSGLLELLQNFEVGRLVLPYMSLRRRLSIAIETGSKRLAPWQLFILDPVGYLSSAASVNVKRLAVVSPSNAENLEDFPLSRTELLDEDIIIEPPPVHPSEIIEGEYFAGSIPVEWLTPSARLKIKGMWEIIPYNDATFEDRASRPFQKAIKKLTAALLDCPKEASQENIKDRMEKLYDKKFGDSSRMRNLISLFVYVGAIDQAGNQLCLYGTSNKLHYQSGDWFRFWNYPGYWHWYLPFEGRCLPKSLLLTGDGSLKTTKQLDALVSYFGAVRMGSVKVFQVMHHGAKTSWHNGVTSAIAPEFSVFCAFPFGHHPHPHPSVEFALRAYGPIQCRIGYGFSLYQVSAHWV